MEVPRLGKSVTEVAVEASLLLAFQTLGYERPTKDQQEAIRAFVSGRDVLVLLPTGSGKSLCFVALPLVFDSLRNTAGRDSTIHHSIVVVISPMTALMKDQVAKYGSSLRCAYLGDEMDDSCREALLRGDYQLLYGSPEAILVVPRWREMLRSTVYEENIVALVVDEVHCISTW